MTMPRYLTAQEVADRLQVSRQLVNDWCRLGELPAMRLGGRAGYRIAEDDLERFVAERQASLPSF